MRTSFESPSSKARIYQISLAIAMSCCVSQNASSQESRSVASFDNGDRLVVTIHWKIEHRGRSSIDVFFHQMGTKEGRVLLAAAASAIGVDPTAAKIITENIPLPHLDPGTTDNRGLLAAPNGMTICKAGPLGNLEVSHAAWSAQIVRRQNQNGLGFYTSVGTSPGTTHRIEGNFYVEYVKPVDGWEQKFGCMPDGQLAWNLKN